jgi:hypothetical protein
VFRGRPTAACDGDVIPNCKQYLSSGVEPIRVESDVGPIRTGYEKHGLRINQRPVCRELFYPGGRKAESVARWASRIDGRQSRLNRQFRANKLREINARETTLCNDAKSLTPSGIATHP